MSKGVFRSENNLMVFISSRMNDEMEPARKIAVKAISQVEFGRPWAFEFTPASAESVEDAYLRKVREADFVVWLAGAETTQPVVDEVNEAISSNRRLLVFKLPAEQRDSQTQELLDLVGRHVKWSEVDCIEDLHVSISDSIADAMIHAVRNPFAPARRKKILQDIRFSVSRCKEQLLSLGVEATIAEEMADDRATGDVLDAPTSGAWNVVGEQGSGKSLAVERLFQRAATDAAEESSRPFPIFLRARDLRGPLTEHIDESLQDYADPYDPRILLIIDGVDELGSNRAADIFRQVAAYADANPEAIVVATTRLLPGVGITDQQITLDPLNDEESVRLIQRVLGRPIEARDMYRWPQSIREARHIPLFAVMIGALLRHDPDLSFANSGQIIERVAEQLLMHEEDNPEELDRLLQMLAFKAIESGTRVDPNAITLVRARQALLQSSRAVEGTSDSLDFALPAFREWYAARALIEGTMSIEHLQMISDRWIPSLSVVLGSGVDEIGEAVLAHIATSDPGLASTLLKENMPDPMRFYGKIPAVTDSRAAGAKIRKSMHMWKIGLEDLYLEIGPANAEGDVSTLAVDMSERHLYTGWYRGQAELADIVEILDHLPDFRPNADWPKLQGWQVDHELTGPSWWSHFAAQKQLSDSLADALNNYSLASDSLDYRRELIWNFALETWGQGEFRQEPLGVDRVLERLGSLSLDTVVSSYRGKDLGAREFEIVADDLSALVERGEREIANPWPGPDLPIGTGFVWNFYSDERILELTREIYSAALRIYVSMVEKWFPRFSRRLSLYRILPVKLVGWLKPGTKEADRDSRPTLRWHVRILPETRQNEVLFELDLGDPDMSSRDLFVGDDLYEEESSAFQALRPNLPGAFSMTLTRSGLSELFDAYPATELAHSWLRRDLNQLGWGTTI